MDNQSFLVGVAAEQVDSPVPFETTKTLNEGHDGKRAADSRHPGIYVLIVVVIILLIFPVITIPILFTQYANMKTQSSSTSTSSAIFAASVTSASELLSVGSPVSISATGAIQVGAGTSIYRGIGIIPVDRCPKYLSATPVFDDMYLVSYKSAATGTGTISVMSVNSTRKSTVLATAYNNNDLYHVVTLCQSTGLFVTISQDDLLHSARPVVIAGKSDKTANYAISFGKAVKYDVYSNTSFDPSIISMSNTTFAVGYYDGSPLSAYTRFGTVDPVTLAITLSAPLRVADDSGYETSIAMTALSATRFLMVYYVGDSYTYSVSGYKASMAITAVVVNVVANTAGVYVQSLNATTALAGSVATGLIRATTLDSGNVVMAYSNVLTNYGVTTVLLEVNEITGAVQFGSVLDITTGRTVRFISSGDVNINLVTIAGGNSFMIMFSDLALDGAIVMAMGESTKSALIRASPNYILNTGNKAINKIHTYISLAVGRSSQYSTHIAILSSLTDTSCTIKPVTDFSLMEIKPKPIGIMTTSIAYTDSLQSGNVALSGLATGFSGLIPGATYFATTSGKLITNGVAYGRDGATASNSAVDGYFYIDDAADKLIVTAESQVGIAVSTTSLLIRLV